MSKLIKPHGSETLNPLIVMDDAKRAELQRKQNPFLPWSFVQLQQQMP